MILPSFNMSLHDFVRAAGAGIAAAVAYVFGAGDKWLIGLGVMMLLDLASGIIAAVIRHELDSRKCLAGFLKKLLLLCAVGVANIIDVATGAGGVLRVTAIGYLIANEGISVLENCGRCGVKLPKKLTAVLEQLRNDNNE